MQPAVKRAVLPGRRLLGQQREMAFVTLWVVVGGTRCLSSGLWGAKISAWFSQAVTHTLDLSVLGPNVK